ncbi:hypothetical protein T492DRAFT_75660 [Pavlovales sp. CCMP2436]|nr:hypothetical protein T492DRAFT_75660 [Pavlovales sp. CCMP2436]
MIVYDLVCSSQVAPYGVSQQPAVNNGFGSAPSVPPGWPAGNTASPNAGFMAGSGAGAIPPAAPPPAAPVWGADWVGGAAGGGGAPQRGVAAPLFPPWVAAPPTLPPAPVFVAPNAAAPVSAGVIRELLYLWHTANLEYGLGAAVDSASAKNWDYDDRFEFGGVHTVFPKGFTRVAEGLAGGLAIRTGTVVKSVTQLADCMLCCLC